MSSDAETVKARIDIADVIQEYVPLKPAGANLKARCPFHEEKTPSFMVHRGKQIFRCFGCNEGGDVFTFLQKQENIEFPEALRILAEKAGVQLKGYDPKQASEKAHLRDINSTAAKFFEATLWSDLGSIARNYLLKERGLQENTLRTFHLGLAPNSWDQLTKFLKTKNFNTQDLVRSGLVIEKQKTNLESSYYDRFRARIIFPITDMHSQVIGFTGRLLPTAETQTNAGKYVNTPETPLYHKAQVLYGLDLARQSIKTAQRTIFVEGQMDVIASHQTGVTNVVAGSGTALTSDQLRLLKRLSPTVTFALDTDPAGEQALVRAAPMAWQLGLEIEVIVLPLDAKDPANLVATDPAKWQHVASTPQPFMDFYLDLLNARHPDDSREAKQSIARQIIPLLASMPDPIERSHYIAILADQLNTAAHYIEEAVNKVVPAASSSKSYQASSQDSIAAAPQAQQNQTARIPELILAIGIAYPELFPIIDQGITPEEFSHPQYGSFYKELHIWYNNQDPQSLANQFNSQSTSNSSNTLANLELLAQKEFSNLSSGQVEIELRRLLKLFKRNIISQRLREVTKNLQGLETLNSDDQETLQQLTEEFRSLTHELKQYE